MMNFGAYIDGNALVITHMGRTALKDITLTPNMTNRGKLCFVPERVLCEEERIVIEFRRDPARDWEPELDFAKLILSEREAVLKMELETKIHTTQMMNTNLFAPEDSFGVNFSIARGDAYFATDSGNPYWMDQRFLKGMTDIVHRTENLCVKMGKEHMHIMPAVNPSVNGRIAATGLVCNLGVPTSSISAIVMSVSIAGDPYTAIENTFRTGREMGIVDGLLRDERKFPEIFNGFGFCTWDAFYSKVNAELIYQKLDEFKEKGIQLRWLLIDDGWSQYTDREAEEGRQLLSFKENSERFPMGLGAFIADVKQRYGIRHVGVWHAFTGYWKGIADDSEIARELPGALTRQLDGRLFPAFDAEGAFLFWDTWHAYLRSQGVDFVKVDNQGAWVFKLTHMMREGLGLRNQHTALDRSVQKHFNGALINCMGGSMQNVLSRPTSPINRSSNDFFPKRERGFSHHIQQNIHATAFMGQWHYCDFDMWWSLHESATQSGVLRAVSGGPVYVSDEVGRTDPAAIAPLIDKEGNIFRVSGNPLVCEDCFYCDCLSEEKPLKLFNHHEDKFIFAAYALVPQKTLEGTLRLSDLRGATGKYVAESYFTKELTLMDENTVIPLRLKDGEVALYNLYPVGDDGLAHLGDPDKYAGIATAPTRTVNAAELARGVKR